MRRERAATAARPKGQARPRGELRRLRAAAVLPGADSFVRPSNSYGVDAECVRRLEAAIRIPLASPFLGDVDVTSAAAVARQREMAEKIEQQAKREAQALADQAEADAAARYRLPRRNKRNREGEPPSVSRNSPLGVAIERAAMARMIGWPALEASWLEDVERLQAAKGKK